MIILTADGQRLVVCAKPHSSPFANEVSRPWAQADFFPAASPEGVIGWIATLKDGHQYEYFYYPDGTEAEFSYEIPLLNSVVPVQGQRLLRGELFNFTVRSNCVGKRLFS